MPKVTYNGQLLPNVVEKFSFQHSYEAASFSCTFLVLAATEVALVSTCDTLETALREWNKNFELKFGVADTVEYSFSHSGNTGYLARPSLSKIPDRGAAGVSRRYKFSVNFKLPADQAGFGYRQSADISLSQNIRGRHILSVSGVYTAGGANSARDNYDANGPAWADSIAASFGTYELTDESTQIEQEDKNLSFRRVYQEKLSIAVTYNGYSIPNSYGRFTLSRSYQSLNFSCEFKIAESLVPAMEAALRSQYKDLLISIGGSPVYNFSHSGNTGFLAQPRIEKISDKSDVDDFKLYRFSLACQLPADDAGFGFRQAGNISISWSPSRRRTVSFSATYTAGGGASAYANYLASGKTWAAGVLTSLGGTYELIGETPGYEHENKVVKITLVYKELLTNDTQSSLDESKIVNAVCDYRVSFGQSIGVSETGGYAMTPVATVSVSYSAGLNTEEHAADTSLEATYRTLIKPWVVKHSFDILGLGQYSDQAGSSYITQTEDYAINPHESTFHGTLVFIAHPSLNRIVKLSETQTRTKNEGLVEQKIWDGKEDTYNLYSIGSQTVLRRSITLEQIGSRPSEPLPLPDENGKKWIRRHISRNEQVLSTGVGPVTSFQQRVLHFVTGFNEEFILVDPVVG